MRMGRFSLVQSVFAPFQAECYDYETRPSQASRG